MARSDTKAYSYDVLHYNDNKEYIKKIGTFHIYLPKQTAMFTTGWFVDYGYPVTSGTNPLYTDMLAKCPDFLLMTFPCICSGTNPGSDTNFKNYFKNFQGVSTVADLGISTSAPRDWLVARNNKNGVCIAKHVGASGGANDQFAYTLEDFENGNAINMGGFAADFFFWAKNGTSSSLGETTGFAYSETDENGDPINFHWTAFRGVTSTTNSIRVTDRGTITSSTAAITAFRAFFASGSPYYTPPYEGFPESTEDPGDPDPDQEDDDIEVDPAPDVSFSDAGLSRIYLATKQQLNDLADYIWTDSNFLQDIVNHAKQLLENPAEAIISLGIVPCVPVTGPLDEVKVLYIGTGVYMYPVLEQYPMVDCGTYTLTEMYGSALDYNPYTRVQLYLPYIGTVDLNTDEVMGKTLHVYYRIDVVTGLCCAYVQVDDDILYQFTGHCALFQPITSADFSGYLNAAIAAAKTVAAVASYGTAPALSQTLVGAATPSISGSSYESKSTTRNERTGRQVTAGTDWSERVTENPGASFDEVAARGVNNTVGAVMNSKAHVAHTGGFSGNSGFLAKRRPFLIIHRPRIANPKNYGKYNGYPSMMNLNLGDCSGYTQVQSIQLTGIAATNPELAEISTLLKSGVIL